MCEFAQISFRFAYFKSANVSKNRLKMFWILIENFVRIALYFLIFVGQIYDENRNFEL